MHFWHSLPKPFFALAPMADVTDVAFRQLFAEYSKQTETNDLVLWTEFVSCDGLWHTREKQGLPDNENPLLKDLLFTKAEQPVVAQLFSAKPEMMEYGARLCRDLGFAGVDINMGCPDKTIEKQGCGSAMIRTPELAKEIIAAAKEGAGALPVSVKTRVGYNQVELETWIPTLLETDLAALTIHARTRKEMSAVPARWEHVARTVELRNDLAPTTKILGNGDVVSLSDAKQKATETNCDGVMVGRGAFGNPWFFNPNLDRDRDVSIAERLTVMVRHCELFEEHLSHKSFHIMKKHFKAYVTGWEGAKELRNQLMESKNAAEVKGIVAGYLQ